MCARLTSLASALRAYLDHHWSPMFQAACKHEVSGPNSVLPEGRSVGAHSWVSGCGELAMEALQGWASSGDALLASFRHEHMPSGGPGSARSSPSVEVDGVSQALA